MAHKKKTSRKSKGISTDNRPIHNQKAPETEKKAMPLSRQCSMEDHDSSDEKFQNLKSLNELLLKQAMENRNQIGSLVQAKDSLETELAHYKSEKTGMCDKLNQIIDENLGLKIVTGLVIGFVENQFREMGAGVERLMREKSDSESVIRVLKGEANELKVKVEVQKEHLRKACDERDLVKNEFDLQREEVNRLKECVIRLEEKESNSEIVIGKLKSENDRLVKERKMREELIEQVKKEKIDLVKAIEEKKKEIGGLKGEIKVLLSEKSEMETGKIEQRGEIKKLEKKLENLNETVQSLTKGERNMQDMVIRLEKNVDESVENQRRMIVEIDAFRKEKTIQESELERLLKEKNSVEKQMEMINVQSSDKDKLIDQLSQEKSVLMEDSFGRERKLIELNQKTDELTHTIAVLQNECNDQTKTNEKLSCKVGQLSDALAQVELKREEADKAPDKEKKHGLKVLKAEVLKSEKMIETTLEELQKTRTERESLFSAKNNLETQSESLKREKAILEEELVELKKAMGALKTELETTGMDAKQSLIMLKRAASMLSQSENQEDRFTNEQQKLENGTDTYTMELESIEKAFRNKEDVIEEMKKEAEIMKQLKEKAHKKQSFWTVVSSMTTILAAASFAYAARTR